VPYPPYNGTLAISAGFTICGWDALYDLLSIGLLAPHLMVMGVAAVGPLVSPWLDWRARRKQNAALEAAARRLAAWSLWLFLVGTVLGFALLAVIWLRGDAAYFAALARLESRIVFGAMELVFSLLCVGGYLVWWRLDQRRSLWRVSLHRLLAVAAGTNLLYHFPLLFLVVGETAADPGGSRPISSEQFRAMAFSTPILARWLHYCFAAAASTGVVLLLLSRDDAGERPRSKADLFGARLALGAAVAQLLTGVWTVATLAPAAQNRVLGGELWPSAALGLSVGLTLWLMNRLAAASFGETSRSSRWITAGLLAAIFLLMSSVSVAAR